VIDQVCDRRRPPVGLVTPWVVTKPDWLAWSLHDARDILGELTRRNVKLSFGGSIHHPTDLWEGLLFNVLRIVVFHQIPRVWPQNEASSLVADRSCICDMCK